MSDIKGAPCLKCTYFCDGDFCTKCNTSQAHFALEQKLRVAREGLEKISKINQFGREGGPIVTSEHYEAAWLDCVELAVEVLDQTK